MSEVSGVGCQVSGKGKVKLRNLGIEGFRS